MYILSEKYVRTPNTHYKKSTSSSRLAINRACVHSFVDATPRDRDWRRSSDDETGERNERTNERTNAFVVVVVVVASRTRARLIGVGKIHSLAERVTKKSTREDSFIHSFVRFGDASGRRNDPAESLDRVDVDGLVRDPAVDG